jgi:hypothetical protein
MCLADYEASEGNPNKEVDRRPEPAKGLDAKENRVKIVGVLHLPEINLVLDEYVCKTKQQTNCNENYGINDQTYNNLA